MNELFRIWNYRNASCYYNTLSCCKADIVHVYKHLIVAGVLSFVLWVDRLRNAVDKLCIITIIIIIIIIIIIMAIAYSDGL